MRAMTPFGIPTYVLQGLIAPTPHNLYFPCSHFHWRDEGNAPESLRSSYLIKSESGGLETPIPRWYMVSISPLGSHPLKGGCPTPIGDHPTVNCATGGYSKGDYPTSRDSHNLLGLYGSVIAACAVIPLFYRLAVVPQPWWSREPRLPRTDSCSTLILRPPPILYN